MYSSRTHRYTQTRARTPEHTYITDECEINASSVSQSVGLALHRIILRNSLATATHQSRQFELFSFFSFSFVFFFVASQVLLSVQSGQKSAFSHATIAYRFQSIYFAYVNGKRQREKQWQVFLQTLKSAQASKCSS